MISIERDDKQIENTANYLKSFLSYFAKSEKEARDISNKIDEIENKLKVVNRMTYGEFGESVNTF